MKPYIANFLVAITLIGLGLWGFFDLKAAKEAVGESVSPTALIPVIIGAIFLLLTPLMKAENKHAAHAVAALTLLMIPVLIKPLTGAIGRGDTVGIARVVIEMAVCALGVYAYVQSFIAVRKARKAAEAAAAGK